MLDALTHTLKELVAIDSTSVRSNLPMLDALEPRLTQAGFRCERQAYADAAGTPKANLLAWHGEGLPELALVGHTDCVPFDAGWREALTLTERGDNLYGRGACDTKGFIACAVEVARATAPRLRKPLLLCFTADEELGCFGAKKLVEAGKGKARRALIGEPTRLQPIRANKGYCLTEVTVTGREGHSAYPDTGKNAIVAAARLIERLQAFADGPLRAELDPAFDPPFATVNVGQVQGGKAKNIIAGHCRFTVEWRPLPGQRVEQVWELLERLAAEVRAQGLDVHLDGARLDRGFQTPPEADLVQYVAARTGQPPGTVPFGTEGPQLTMLGAQSVVFGPGDITVAHQTGEYVPKAQLDAAANVMTQAVLHFCGGAP